jgi:soluble lytic murein transglycosylase-like protein
MIKPFQAVFLGFFTGISILLLITSRIALPLQIVSAASGDSNGAVLEQSNNFPDNESADESCPLTDHFPQSIQQWCQLIMINSQEYNIDEVLLAAVMLQESGGDSNAYSKSGAVGLMQVMPKDGIAENFMCVNGPCFAARPSMQELFDPAFNIDYGARMLANLFQKHGNWRDSLKFYGPMDVDYGYSDLVLSIYEQYQ